MKMIDLDHILQHAESVGIAGHIRPDGDCTGSCLGLYNFIRTYYPNISVKVNLQPFSESFSFLQGSDEVDHESSQDRSDDVFFCLDCGDAARLGDNVKYFENAAHTVCIDHHISNLSFADENLIVPDASSTSELVADLIGADRFTKEIAECLYLGIVHDTGVFQYSCTSSHTMEIAGRLMETGIDYSTIVADTFFVKTHLQQKLLGHALEASVLSADGKIISCGIDRQTLEKFGAAPSDLDGIVAVLRNTKGVETAIFMYETDDGLTKVSMRSGNVVDVARIAVSYGGGGHKKAAGCSMAGTFAEILDKLLEQITEQLNYEE